MKEYVVEMSDCKSPEFSIWGTYEDLQSAINSANDRYTRHPSKLGIWVRVVENSGGVSCLKYERKRKNKEKRSHG